MSEIVPSNFAAFQMLGTAQYVLGDVQGAVGNYEHAVRLNPNGAATPPGWCITSRDGLKRRCVRTKSRCASIPTAP